MAKPKSTSSDGPAGNLKVSRRQAESKLRRQIAKGIEIVEEYGTFAGDEALGQYQAWDKKNRETLASIFEGMSSVRRYIAEVGTFGGNPFDVFGLKTQVEKCNGTLQGIVNELILYEEPGIHAAEKSAMPPHKPRASDEVFIVHGTDARWKSELARFLESGGLRPIILHEQSNQGKTVIEKLETYSETPFAVVILTADDIGGKKGTTAEQLRARARQNVIFELGFFSGKAGRRNVCALYEEGVEVPSDYAGVVYVPLDEREGWKVPLARELKTAGLPFNIDKAIK